MKYEVIIAGASFAGLSVASKLKCKTLLIDRYDIGSHQISACGTQTKTMEMIGCQSSILQSFNTIAIHIQDQIIDIALAEPFCTIDYKKFCELLNMQNNAEFVQANIIDCKDNVVITSRGDFTANLIVDATGWEAKVISSLHKDYFDINMLSCGIETEIEYADDKLRFFLDKKLHKNGVGWLFPAGKKSRFGVASYVKDSSLHKQLQKFVEKDFGLKIADFHGGCFCYCQKQPTKDGIFAVGCSAGQTLPLTGEGIRRSINFGLYCGNLIQQIVDKQISKKEAFAKYDAFALKGRKQYSLLLRWQRKLPTLPIWQIKLIAKILSCKLASKYAWEWYKKI